MLVPAMFYKDEIERQFAKRIYDDDMFYYQGYAHGHEMTEIKPQDNLYQWAIVGNEYERELFQVKSFDGERQFIAGKKYPTGKKAIIGYFSYRIYPATDNVYNFGLYSFDKGNALIGHDVFKKMEELINEHHRIEWRCIGGNKALRGYVWFMGYIHKKYGYYVYKHRLTDVTKTVHGDYRPEHIFEIVNKEA